MTDSFRIIKVPYVDDIFVNHTHTTLQGVISKVWTRSKVTPISYVCKGACRNYSMLFRRHTTHDFAQLWRMGCGNNLKNEDDCTYSMEAWMMISWFTLCAMDHARNAGAIDGTGS
jgi:hypothetical protein